MFVGGWSTAAILNYYSGAPLAFSGSFPLSGGWNGAVNRANILPGDMKAAGFDKGNFELSSATSPRNTYLNKSLFSDPPESAPSPESSVSESVSESEPPPEFPPPGAISSTSRVTVAVPLDVNPSVAW